MSLLSSNHTIPQCNQYWHYDDFTTCGKHQLLEAYPGYLASISLALVIITYLRTHSSGSIKLKPSPENEPLFPENSQHGFDSINEEEGISSEALTLAQQHFDIAHSKPVNEDGKSSGSIKFVFRDTTEKLKVGVEAVLLVIQLAICVTPFLFSDLAEEWKHDSYSLYLTLFFWGYLFLVSTLRLFTVSTGLSNRLPNMWYHSFFLYTFNIFGSFFLLRSALLGNTKTTYGKWFYCSEFTVSVLLFIVSGSFKFGDKPVEYFVQEDTTPSPEFGSSFFQIVSYAWLDSMVIDAYKNGLKITDIWGLRADDFAFPVLMKYHATYQKHRFTVRLFAQFWKQLALQFILAAVGAVLTFAPTLLLKSLLEYVETPGLVSDNLAWLFAFLMLVVNVISACFDGRCLFIGRRVCTRMRAVIIGEVYAKALRRCLNKTGKDEKEKNQEESKKDNDSASDNESEEEENGQKDLGAIINLMAVDAFKVSEICGYLHYFVSSLVMAVIAIYLLYNLLGWPALAGAVTITLFIPLNYKITKVLGDYQRKMLKITDKRIQKLNETFQNIRIIKFFGWEDKFAQEILEIREEELEYLKMRCIIWVAGCFLWYATPTLIAFVGFYCYAVVEGKPLTPPIAFTALSLFSLLKSPLDQFADMLSFVIQSKVSLDRIEDFLNETETTKYEQLAKKGNANSPVVGFENATFSWDKDSATDFKLRDINIDFKVGKLNVIIGATGAGKSSLLLALLGEMELLEGNVFIPGIIPREELVPNKVTGLTESVAYCSQTPWLLNATVKDNIVFASPFDEKRYKAVIKACGLKRDLEILEGGDQTEVGEKGITLSGGQKQRVSLARALYSSASYVLLDDCLSAVDSHTGVHIYENCITGDLMKNRTCILVSHNVTLTIKQADHIVIMDNGRVKTQGSVDKLIQENALENDVVKSVMGSAAPSSVNLVGMNREPESHDVLKGIVDAIATKGDMIDTVPEDDDNEEVNVDDKKKKGKLVDEETKSDGSVDIKVYKAYVKFFGSKTVWSTLIATFAAGQAIYIFQSWWLRSWSLAEENRYHVLDSFLVNSSGLLSPFFPSKLVSVLTSIQWTEPIISTPISTYALNEEHSTLYFISIYACIGLLYSFVGSARVIIAFYGGLQASRGMFKVLLFKVLRANLRFFDSTPVGRIMNRFSKDIESVDQEVAPCGENFVVCLIACICTIGVICSITPVFLFFSVFIAIIYYMVGVLYLNLSRDLKRFESITRSPIHQHFTETLVGVTTIRAYGDERRFLIQNMNKIDENNKPFFYVWVNNRWLAFRTDMIGSCIVFLAAVLAVAYASKIDSGLAGISLTFAVSFNQNAIWVLRMYAMVEINMNSVERIQEYIEDTVQEPPAEIPESDPPSSWPEHGAIEVKDLSLRYAPALPRVIDTISFNVKPGEKVGVVGRTGAGKSTIITSFFRFIDPDSGYIKIDNVDICTIGLKKLRQALTIIPQDPTLFTGTIRSNLDLFNEYADLQMFEALRRVNLISTDDHQALIDGNGTASDSAAQHENQNKFLDLENPITENGGNLSQGERQLVCLARSLLKSPKVLMLDEATASIDYEADAMIQKTIREEFSSTTILTIAHRLKTIIDYDKILVLDAGKVKEYDHPYKLITDSKSQFREMCQQTGEFDDLVAEAKKAFVNLKNN